MTENEIYELKNKIYNILTEAILDFDDGVYNADNSVDKIFSLFYK